MADLGQRRKRLLLRLLINERNHTGHYTDAFRLHQAKQLIKTLEKQIAQCDAAIADLIAQDPQLTHKANRLKAIPGVGPVVTATMLAEMPELGKLTPQTAAALAGVAPYKATAVVEKEFAASAAKPAAPYVMLSTWQH